MYLQNRFVALMSLTSSTAHVRTSGSVLTVVNAFRIKANITV